jgi:hypothetical protein
MEKRIYKYPLLITGIQMVELPVGAEILTVQTQNESPCLWALVDHNEIEKKKVLIEMFGTGHDVQYGMGASRKYISTFQLKGGSLVFHAFEYTGV